MTKNQFLFGFAFTMVNVGIFSVSLGYLIAEYYF